LILHEEERKTSALDFIVPVLVQVAAQEQEQVLLLVQELAQQEQLEALLPVSTLSSVWMQDHRSNTSTQLKRRAPQQPV
jgi:hypothetical protein